MTLEGRRGTTDKFAAPLHLVLFSAALIELAKSIPIRSLILSSHLFFCLPLFLFPFTVPCRIFFGKPEDLETWPNHLSFRFFTRVRSSSYLVLEINFFTSSKYLQPSIKVGCKTNIPGSKIGCHLTAVLALY